MGSKLGIGKIFLPVYLATFLSGCSVNNPETNNYPNQNREISEINLSEKQDCRKNESILERLTESSIDKDGYNKYFSATPEQVYFSLPKDDVKGYVRAKLKTEGQYFSIFYSSNEIEEISRLRYEIKRSIRLDKEILFVGSGESSSNMYQYTDIGKNGSQEHKLRSLARDVKLYD